MRNYIDKYNASADRTYTSTLTESKVELHLVFSGEISNNPFASNADNLKVPLIGGELEIYEANILPRHSGFLQARPVFDAGNFQYSTTNWPWAIGIK